MATKRPSFTFQLSSDINIPVSYSICNAKAHAGCQPLPVFLQCNVRVCNLMGCIPAFANHQQSSDDLQERPGSAGLYVVCYICAHGEVQGLPSRTCFAEAGPGGCSWTDRLQFPAKVSQECPGLCIPRHVWCQGTGALPPSRNSPGSTALPSELTGS